MVRNESASPRPGSPASGSPPVVEVPETEGTGKLPHLLREDWSRTFPWLVQGVTHRGGDGDGAPWDFRIRGPEPGGDVLERWDVLREALDADTVVHSLQVHGAGVRVHRAGGTGLLLTPPCDGHVTADPAVLLTVSVADCVPLFLVAPGPRIVGLLHVGWRGLAAGIVEAGVAAFRDRFGVGPDELHLHLGPSISAPAYEVGPEVHRALGLPDPGAPRPLDLRAVAAGRAADAGVPGERMGASPRCTRQDPLLFSHRGGDQGRQVAFVGIRDRRGAVR